MYAEKGNMKNSAGKRVQIEESWKKDPQKMKKSPAMGVT